MSGAGRILVVEDEPVARQALGELLRDEGYDVAVAADGLQVEAELDHFDPDLVLSDVQLPGRDGLALLQAVRARPHAPAVVLMSARDADGCGALLLRKPIDVDELLHAVAAELRARKH
jgi:DNA-binding response OmpR family regulator